MKTSSRSAPITRGKLLRDRKVRRSGPKTRTTIPRVLVSMTTTIIMMMTKAGNLLVVTYHLRKRDKAGRATALLPNSRSNSALTGSSRSSEAQVRRNRIGTNVRKRLHLLQSSSHDVVLGSGDQLSGQEMCMESHELLHKSSKTLKACADGLVTADWIRAQLSRDLSHNHERELRFPKYPSLHPVH